MSAQHQLGFVLCVGRAEAAPGLDAVALLLFVLGIANSICRLFTLSQRFDESTR
jgi:hypothetical protein